ncbi:hypothetical protein [Streptomyces flavofungini]|uniref:hypothetical protein n=1 Tax=Streptomyces flavofungini TaxID=68200 RepID=UPI003F540A52
MVRGAAALALGTRDAADAIPTLIGDDRGGQERHGRGRRVERAGERHRAGGADRARARRAPRPRHRWGVRTRTPAQAFAGIAGTTAARTLAALSHHEHRAVALTATYFLRLREAR